MNNLHDVIIEMSGPSTGRVLVDGKPLSVTKVSMSAGVGEVTEVTLTILAGSVNAQQSLSVQKNGLIIKTVTDGLRKNGVIAQAIRGVT